MYSTFVLPQRAKTTFPVNTEAGNNVMISTADRDFGPVQADENGKAPVPIVVPPGSLKSTLIVVSGDKQMKNL